jgi:hypothetical protein
MRHSGQRHGLYLGGVCGALSGFSRDLLEAEHDGFKFTISGAGVGSKHRSRDVEHEAVAEQEPLVLVAGLPGKAASCSRGCPERGHLSPPGLSCHIATCSGVGA